LQKENKKPFFTAKPLDQHSISIAVLMNGIIHQKDTITSFLSVTNNR